MHAGAEKTLMRYRLTRVTIRTSKTIEMTSRKQVAHVIPPQRKSIFSELKCIPEKIPRSTGEISYNSTHTSSKILRINTGLYPQSRLNTFEQHVKTGTLSTSPNQCCHTLVYFVLCGATIPSFALLSQWFMAMIAGGHPSSYNPVQSGLTSEVKDDALIALSETKRVTFRRLLLLV